jgi:hypothetical protein
MHCKVVRLSSNFRVSGSVATIVEYQSFRRCKENGPENHMFGHDRESIASSGKRVYIFIQPPNYAIK